VSGNPGPVPVALGNCARAGKAPTADRIALKIAAALNLEKARITEPPSGYCGDAIRCAARDLRLHGEIMLEARLRRQVHRAIPCEPLRGRDKRQARAQLRANPTKWLFPYAKTATAIRQWLAAPAKGRATS